MRLLRVWIDGYRNLKNVEVNFDRENLTTVVIGENGSGKSNLIEAIVEVFRACDPKFEVPKFSFSIEYLIRDFRIKLEKQGGKLIAMQVDHAGQSGFTGGHFVNPASVAPDLIFGYYSGSGSRLEKLFEPHQKNYYDTIKNNITRQAYDAAKRRRRLFYCRPFHGALALLAQFGHPGDSPEIAPLVQRTVRIKGFHSALAVLKQPSWFQGSQVQARREAQNLWGAHGPAGECARALQRVAFHPIEIGDAKVIDDYRKQAKPESQVGCFIRDENALQRFSRHFNNDRDMFDALEATDISDLFRDVIVWVDREMDGGGDISFSDLSDGERQLLMVLGLIRVSRGKEALFLLDEPDTHLNPAWQLTYLELIREWTELAADEDKCQIIMTTHNPLTIAALEAKEVRIMSSDASGQVSVAPPRIDPKGLGFAGVLTDIFGLSSTLDKPTQELIDRRNELARKEQLTPAMAKEFADIREELRHLGFLYEERDKLYSEFLKQLDKVELADVDPLTPDELRAREAESRRIVEELLSKK
ncbi:UNVERIFIED_ORG: putative ATPase [Sphingomonas sp. R1F5B]